MAKKTPENPQYEAMFLLGPVAGAAEDVTVLPKGRSSNATKAKSS